MACCSVGRLGVVFGFLALAVLLISVMTNAWLFTREHVRHTPVTFRIGLWSVCPQVKRIQHNATNILTSPGSCSPVRYASWDDITYGELGVSVSPPHQPDFEDMTHHSPYTPAFVSKMRWATPLCVSSCILVTLATLLAVLGHCSEDHKTLLACGLYIIGGLTLGGGLVVFASVLSDVYIERPRQPRGDLSGSFDYKYGWSYLLAGAAFVLIELTAVINVTAYLGRFPTVDDMVRAMVPGAERRLREHQGLAGEYLVQHRHKYQRHKTDSSSLPAGLSTRCLSKSDVGRSDEVEGPLLSKPAPDICTTGPSAAAATSNAGYLLDEPVEDLAGTSVPIVLMPHRGNPNERFSTLQPKGRPQPLHGAGGTLPHKHRGIPIDARGVTLDAHAFAEHLHRKDGDGGHMTLNQRFGSVLSSGLDSGTGTLVSQGDIGPKKSAVLGSVFSAMDGGHVDSLYGSGGGQE